MDIQKNIKKAGILAVAVMLSAAAFFLFYNYETTVTLHPAGAANPDKTMTYSDDSGKIVMKFSGKNHSYKPFLIRAKYNKTIIDAFFSVTVSSTVRIFRFVLFGDPDSTIIISKQNRRILSPAYYIHNFDDT
ncbi:MAG: hypothetical protein ABSG94_00015 [Brevinematales bacterium]|jgi:hypothetical protein